MNMHEEAHRSSPQVDRRNSVEVNIFEVVEELKDLERNYGIVIEQIKALEPNDDTGRAFRTRKKMETAMTGLSRLLGDPDAETFRIEKWLQERGEDVGPVPLAASAHIQLKKTEQISTLQSMIDVGMRQGPQELIKQFEDEGAFRPRDFDAAELKRAVTGV